MSFHIDILRIIQYLKEREKDGKAFSFAPDPFPDLEDTYDSIAIAGG